MRNVAAKVGGLLMVLAAAGLAFSCRGGSAKDLSVAGQVEAVSVAAGSRVGGRVSEVLVEEGQRVDAGQVLVKLETDEAEAVLAAAKAKLAQAEATLEKIKTGARPEEIRQAEAVAEQAKQRYRIAQEATRPEDLQAAIAQEDAARAQRDQAKSDFVRIEKLYQSQAVPQQRYDQAKHALEAAEAQLQAVSERRKLAQTGARSEEIEAARAAAEQAQAALDLLKNGARKEDIDAAQAVRDSAAADVARAEVNLRESVIVSPRNGVVDSLDLHPGDLVRPGAVVTVVDVEDLEMYVYVSAGVLGYLRLGQEVTLSADAYPGETFKGTVAYIASSGEFTPRNLQTQEERVQQVFGVKIKMGSFGGRIRAGMSMTAQFPLKEKGLEQTGAGSAGLQEYPGDPADEASDVAVLTAPRDDRSGRLAVFTDRRGDRSGRSCGDRCGRG